MAERNVILTATDEIGRFRYTRSEARQLVGRSFPIEGVRGDARGEGVIRKATLMDPDGQQLMLVVEVPPHLAKGFETDTGRVPRPLPGLPGS